MYIQWEVEVVAMTVLLLSHCLVEQLGFYGPPPPPSLHSLMLLFPSLCYTVLATIVKELDLTAAERCRPQIRDACFGGEMDGVYRYNQWIRSLAGVVAARPVEDVEKAVVIFKEYNEPFLASRLNGE